jgi:uncharacterized protein YkwD
MFKRLGLLAAITLASSAGLVAGGEGSEAVAATCASATAKPSMTLCLINVQRHSHGVPAVRLNPRLSQAARAHSRDMVRRRYFSHTTPEGLRFADRIRGTGYLRASRQWFVGENLAWGWRGRDSARRIVRAWMHSPPHREVMLNPAFREVGIGIVSGVPRPLPPGGATYTADFGVTR